MCVLIVLCPSHPQLATFSILSELLKHESAAQVICQDAETSTRLLAVMLEVAHPSKSMPIQVQ
jgi:ABC-type thiamine transport system substrate-binding protein